MPAWEDTHCDVLKDLRSVAEIDPALTQVDLGRIASAVAGGAIADMTREDLVRLTAETAAGHATEDPEYGRLAARILVAEMHARIPESFRAVVSSLRSSVACSGVSLPLVTDELAECARLFEAQIDAETDHARDYRAYDFFALSTLLSGYLMQTGGQAAERPSHMLWRVAFGIHGQDWPNALATFRALASGALTHASPTIFYAGTPGAALSSCYITQFDDSIDGIYSTVRDCALISKSGGGIGVTVSKVRANGALVRSTGRPANGVLPALRVLNEAARHVTQGGRRKGAIAVYVEPHHADIFSIIDLRKNHGIESDRARDLFPAVWVSDLFMRRVEADQAFTLFSPDTAPGLEAVFGDEYTCLYETYEARGLGIRSVRARDLWAAILSAQCETGTPYLLFKDAVNRANAQANIGMVPCSNLCSEICLHVSADETAVCNLASISLPRFVDAGAATFDFAAMERVVAMAVNNLDLVIDRTVAPTPAAKNSNVRNRPIGIGVQGLADVFMLLRLPFDCEAARELNVAIFECLYRAAVCASADLAKARGVYPTYDGSPASRGVLQPDMFLSANYGSAEGRERLRQRLDTDAWAEARRKVQRHGLRHSVLVALMPTAATAQILGNVESMEPQSSNLFVRRTLAGEFTLVNEKLVRELRAIGMWSQDVRHEIIRAEGSVQTLAIPDELKRIFRTAWEIPQKSVVEMAADRTPFVDQSQSLNVFMRAPTIQKLTSLHFLNWRNGVKTSSYYVRSQAASSAIKVTVPVERDRERAEVKGRGVRAGECDGDVCVACSS